MLDRRLGVLFAGACFVAGLTGCAASTSMIRGSIPPQRAVGSIVMAWPTSAPAPIRRARYARIDQTKRGFVPNVAIVEAGTTVVFHNEDRVFHNAFCVLPDAPFDVGTYPPGKTRRIRLLRPGVYHVFCELHPNESAHILVTPNRWHTRPREDGSFVLRNVPPGTYQVRVWHPDRKDLDGTVEVTSKKPAVVEF